MKRILISVISLMILVAGCKKDDITDEPAEEYSIKAEVDGKTLSAQMGILSASIVNKSGDAENYLEMATYVDSAVYIRLRVMFDHPFDKSDLQTGKVNDFYLKYFKAGKSWVNEKYNFTDVQVSNPSGVPDGRLNIEGISDTNIWGTFSFVGYNSSDGSTVTVSDGEFNANFSN